MARRMLSGALLVALVAFALHGCARHRARLGPPAPTRTAADLGVASAALREAGPASGLGKPQSLDTYLPARMYEAIDGEADLFVSYQTRGLAVAHYASGKAMIAAEVFDQGEPLNAFGVYSQLRPSDAVPAAVGAGAVKMPDQGVFLWKSRYFARISVISTARPGDQVMMRLAQAVAARLPGASDLPAWTTALPPEGLARGSVQYVARNVLGHGFLSHAMIGDYGAGVATCRLVLARADDEAQARDAWRQLREAYHGAGDRSLTALGPETFTGADMQGQPVRAVRSGRYLVIAVGKCDAGRAKQLLAATLRRLQG